MYTLSQMYDAGYDAEEIRSSEKYSPSDFVGSGYDVSDMKGTRQTNVFIIFKMKTIFLSKYICNNTLEVWIVKLMLRMSLNL